MSRFLKRFETDNRLRFSAQRDLSERSLERISRFLENLKKPSKSLRTQFKRSHELENVKRFRDSLNITIYLYTICPHDFKNINKKNPAEPFFFAISLKFFSNEFL